MAQAAIGQQPGTTQRWAAVPRNGRCLHPYWYLIDRVLGWMRVRIQTWTSHSTQIYVNGRDCVGKRRKTGLLSGAATTGEISQTTPAMTSA
jgi:hypothetical protein